MTDASKPPTIAEFLTARLDEREHAAKTCADAFPSPWELSDRGWMAKVSADAPAFRTVAELEQSKTLDGEGWVGNYLQHIAFHDPARVLADIAAKRAIIEFHKQWPVLVEGPTKFDQPDPSDLDSMVLKMSRQIMWATEQEYRNRFGDEPPTTPIMRALASVYSDHPDYRQEWTA